MGASEKFEAAMGGAARKPTERDALAETIARHLGWQPGIFDAVDEIRAGATHRTALAAHLYRTAARATGEPQTAWELIDQGVWLRAADEAVAAMGADRG